MEKFKIIDLKHGINKKNNQPYFYAIIYSDLGYIFNAYLSNEEDFRTLNNMDYFSFDLTDILKKRYNKNNNSFSYHIEIN